MSYISTWRILGLKVNIRLQRKSLNNQTNTIMNSYYLLIIIIALDHFRKLAYFLDSLFIFLYQILSLS